MCAENCSMPILQAHRISLNSNSPSFWYFVTINLVIYVVYENRIFLALCILICSEFRDHKHMFCGIQERLNSSLMVCQDKFESAKMQQMRTDATKDMESCDNQTVEEHVKALPHLVAKLKASLNINPINE